MGKVVPLRPFRVKADRYSSADAQVIDDGVYVRVRCAEMSAGIVLSAKSARTLGENLVQFAAQFEADTKGAG